MFNMINGLLNGLFAFIESLGLIIITIMVISFIIYIMELAFSWFINLF